MFLYIFVKNYALSCLIQSKQFLCLAIKCLVGFLIRFLHFFTNQKLRRVTNIIVGLQQWHNRFVVKGQFLFAATAI